MPSHLPGAHLWGCLEGKGNGGGVLMQEQKCIKASGSLSLCETLAKDRIL